MDPVSPRVRQTAPRRHHLVQDSGLLWIIRDGPCVRTGEHDSAPVGACACVTPCPSQHPNLADAIWGQRS